MLRAGERHHSSRCRRRPTLEPVPFDIRDIIGPDSTDITWWQMSIRAVVIFLFTILLIRLGKKRAFGKNTSFDIVLGVILGSILSRALTGNAPLFGTMAAALVMVALHMALAAVAFRSNLLGTVVKGGSTLLVRDGEILWDAMRASRITRNDLMEAIRLSGEQPDLDRVDAAYLERSGDISVIPRSD
jgi:uncharacterized membrane protein YcaP (DUF421 family)